MAALSVGRAVSDAACPFCGPSRKTPANRARKVLRLWDDGKGFINYHCERCSANGYAKEKSGGTTVKRQPRPAPASAAARIDDDKAELVRNLWTWSSNAKGTLAETYLRSRHCWIESENIRYLHARGRHPPTMIARFGAFTDKLTGLHLTRLAADGQSKAGTDADKIMLGPSKGQPLIVHVHDEHGVLIISEGIEDAASWAVATGWTSWAAGAAGRISAVVERATAFEQVYISLDYDEAGLKAIEAARAIRPDLIKIEFDKVFNSSDANKVMMKLGAATLLGVAVRSRLRQEFAAGKLGLGAYQRELERCGRV